MMPIAPLMIEHRLIERAIKVAAREAERIGGGGDPDPDLLDRLCDFLRTYADHCHHGKEEDILFRDLRNKPLSDEHRRTMERLVADHVTARGLVRDLSAYSAAARQADPQTAARIADDLRALAGLYPGHIATEDKGFFIPVMSYFTKPEQDAMLEECHEFDRRFVHDTYRAVVEALEASE